MSVKSSVVSADYTDLLHILTSSYAAAAKDTLVVVANDGNRGKIERILGLFALEVFLVNTVLLAELLELAGGAADAGQTLSVVVGKNELEVGLTSLSDSGAISSDFHTLVYGIYAGGNESAGALDFNEAETACADLVDVLHIA